MTDKESTPPPSRVPEPNSSPLTPNPKRAKMASSDLEKESQNTGKGGPAEFQANDTTATENSAAAADLTVADEEDLEADEGFADSAFGTDSSDSTSITSSIYQGYVENGRRYQTKREGEYWGPSDEKQFESQQKSHIVHCILDSGRENPSFYSPLSEKKALNILDIGTGTGDWARDVADRLPSAFVQGVDLAPVPDNWMPPNCKFEVDDVLKPWEFKENGRFDFVHLRYMLGAFTDEQWRLLYKQAYKNLAPGGWIEQIEGSIVYLSDDNTLPADSFIAAVGPMFQRCCAKSGKNIDTVDTFKARINAAGFTNLHEKLYKLPVGDWAKNPVLKEAGKFHKAALLEGYEGYSMFILTHFGEPTPWAPEEVQVYVAKIKQELNNPAIHSYHVFRRVWAQKPLDKAE